MRSWLPALLCVFLLTACGGDDDAPADRTASTATATSAPTPTTTPAAGSRGQLVVTSSSGSYLSLVDAVRGDVQGRVPVGPAPHRLARSGDLGYVTTAKSLTVIHIRTGEVLAQLPLQGEIGEPTEGLFREGGMGVAVSPDGQRIFVGVYAASGSSLQVYHFQNGYERSIPVGGRPLDVVVAPDGAAVYVIDADSASITAVDTSSWEPRTIDLSPYASDEDDNSRYAAIAGDELLLSLGGRVLAMDLETEVIREITLAAGVEWYGIAPLPGGESVAIVRNAPGSPGNSGLSIVTLSDGSERFIALAKPHELVALSPDGKTAYLTGGHAGEGGWDGVTVVDLESGDSREIYVPDLPLGIIVLAPSSGD